MFISSLSLGEASTLACMTYVDLNPIRSGIAATPEKSEFTSVKKRLESAEKGSQPKTVYPFVGNERKGNGKDTEKGPLKGIGFKLTDYLQLVDLTGRIVRHDKRGAMDLSLSPILQRLGMDSENWKETAKNFEQYTILTELSVKLRAL